MGVEWDRNELTIPTVSATFIGPHCTVTTRVVTLLALGWATAVVKSDAGEIQIRYPGKPGVQAVYVEDAVEWAERVGPVLAEIGQMICPARDVSEDTTGEVTASVAELRSFVERHQW